MNTNPFYQRIEWVKSCDFDFLKLRGMIEEKAKLIKSTNLPLYLLLYYFLVCWLKKISRKKKFREIHEKLIRARKKNVKKSWCWRRISASKLMIWSSLEEQMWIWGKIRQKFSPREKIFLLFPIKICRWSWELRKSLTNHSYGCDNLHFKEFLMKIKTWLN